MKGMIYTMESSLSDKLGYFDDNYKIICENIAKASEKSGRKYEDITLLAATKTVEVDVINYAISKGLKAIGENRVQEFLSKYEKLDREHCDMQLIGRLQTNKVKYIVDKVSCIQSVDSIKLAKEISRISTKHDKVMDILIEVNIGSEDSKGGVCGENLFEIVDEIREMPGIHINGLMCIPPICENNVELEQFFLKMREYYVDIQSKKLDNVSMNVLSMGMSDDYAKAIECGSNMVRIGSALFGKRNYNMG